MDHVADKFRGNRVNRCLTLELRDDGRFHGTLIQEGRVADSLAEVFAPGSLKWAGTGVDIKDGHGGESLAWAHPVRRDDGRITVAIPASPLLRAAVAKSPHMSIEFYALEERRNKSNVREITSAFLAAGALVANPEYSMTKAEIRSSSQQIWL